VAVVEYVRLAVSVVLFSIKPVSSKQ
jgi:hypothetical protein